MSLLPKSTVEVQSGDTVSDATSGELTTDPARSSPAHSSSHVSCAGVVSVDRFASSVPDPN